MSITETKDLRISEPILSINNRWVRPKYTVLEIEILNAKMMTLLGIKMFNIVFRRIFI